MAANRKVESMTADEARKAILWPTTRVAEETTDSSGWVSADLRPISASAVPMAVKRTRY